eukprot:8260171-Alexandrium_andersonii.AAC.1
MMPEGRECGDLSASSEDRPTSRIATTDSRERMQGPQHPRCECPQVVDGGAPSKKLAHCVADRQAAPEA